jgi:hypothetical protein
MLPEDQRATFIKTYADAFRLGRQGRVTIGYVILDLGLDQAERDRRAGAFWAEEVVGLYRDALRSFVERFGMPEPWPPVQPEGAADLLVAILARRLDATTRVA